jgi:DNA primase
VEALRHVLEQSRGLFEYLIDILLDESFNAADLREKATRVEQVGALIARQKDPVVRGMAEAYSDQAAGRLDLVRSSPGAFGVLKRQILSQARAARIDFGPRPSEARMKQRPEGSEDRKAIVEAILDFPELLDDSEVQAILPHLEANSARIVAAMGNTMRLNARGEKVLDTTEFLAQMPDDTKAFASARLAAPLYETIDEARETVAKAAKRLRGTSVARETNEIVREQHRVIGDWDTEVDLLKQSEELVRQRLMGK